MENNLNFAAENNLELYNSVRKVPENALKEIKGGRLNGMTDINAQWRIEKLTEVFGPCGYGWKTKIIDMQLREGYNSEQKAFVVIELYVLRDGKWSEPIMGIGGSTFVEKNNSGYYTNDECFKMAYTDAISVACKALGFGADIYWNTSDSKYSNVGNAATGKTTTKTADRKETVPSLKASEAQLKMLNTIAGKTDYFKKAAAEFGYKASAEILKKDVNAIKARIEEMKGENN